MKIKTINNNNQTIAVVSGDEKIITDKKLYSFIVPGFYGAFPVLNL